MNNSTKQRLNNPEFEALRCRLILKPIKPVVQEAHLAAIGRVVVRFARLEDQMKDFIGTLISGDEKIVSIVTCDASFRNLISILREAHRHVFGDSEDMKILLRAIDNVEQVRNQFLHSRWIGWSADQAMRTKVVSRPKTGLYRQDEIYSLEDLEEIADWIDKVDTAVQVMKIEDLWRRAGIKTAYETYLEDTGAVVKSEENEQEA